MKRIKKNNLFYVFISAAFLSGLIIGVYAATRVPENVSVFYIPKISLEGYEELEISIKPPTLYLTSGCKQISFDITDDQAFSIVNAMDSSMLKRPLTHDIMTDIFETFGIEVLSIKIDSFEDEIYYAKIILKNRDKILNLDARPSDSVALAIRLNKHVYIKKTILQEQGTDICE